MIKVCLLGASSKENYIDIIENIVADYGYRVMVVNDVIERLSKEGVNFLDNADNLISTVLKLQNYEVKALEELILNSEDYIIVVDSSLPIIYKGFDAGAVTSCSCSEILDNMNKDIDYDLFILTDSQKAFDRENIVTLGNLNNEGDKLLKVADLLKGVLNKVKE